MSYSSTFPSYLPCYEAIAGPKKHKRGPNGHFTKPEIRQNHIYETTHGTAHHCKNSANRARRGRHGKDFKIFTLGPLVAKVGIESTQFLLPWFRDPQGILAPNFNSICPAVSEEKIFENWEEEKKQQKNNNNL